jgi:pilus assembly protein Flp/PilA
VTRTAKTPCQTLAGCSPFVFRRQFAHLYHDESGQDLIEYALLAALIGLAAATSMKGLATKISGAFTSIGSTLTCNT